MDGDKINKQNKARRLFNLRETHVTGCSTPGSKQQKNTERGRDLIKEVIEKTKKNFAKHKPHFGIK